MSGVCPTMNANFREKWFDPDAHKALLSFAPEVTALLAANLNPEIECKEYITWSSLWKPIIPFDDKQDTPLFDINLDEE